MHIPPIVNNGTKNPSGDKNSNKNNAIPIKNMKYPMIEKILAFMNQSRFLVETGDKKTPCSNLFILLLLQDSLYITGCGII
jgi:hypothetical protein